MGSASARSQHVNIASGRHLRLRVLGQLALSVVGVEGETPLPVRPRHLAVLAVLALSRRALRRAHLASLFWGEEPEGRARHSLSNALSALRGVLGRDAVAARRDDIVLDPDLRLAIDAVEFESACETGESSRAIQLYAGPPFGDTPLADDGALASWVARERGRLDRLFVGACEREIPRLLARGEWSQATDAADRWIAASRASTAAIIALLRARAGPGTMPALRDALAEYRRIRVSLADRAGSQPDAAVVALAADLERRLLDRELEGGAALGAQPAAPPAPAAPEIISSSDPPTAAAVLIQTGARIVSASHATVEQSTAARVRRSGERARWTAWARVAAVAGVVALAALLRVAQGPHSVEALASRPIIAIADIENVRPDTALEWLEDGLAQLIADDLASAPGVDAVTPSRVRDVRRREGNTGRTLTIDAAIDVARRVGATWAVSGGLTRGGGLYVLDMTIRDVRTRRPVADFTVLASNPVELGHLAAARLLQAGAASPAGSDAPPQLTDVASTSPVAYQHFMRALRLSGEGVYPEDLHEIDDAIALDSGFVAALRVRRDIALAHGDPVVAARCEQLIDLHPDRMSDWDRLEEETERALRDGARARSEALAAHAVNRYPRDPRAYDLRASVLITHGQWLAADSVYQRELALDSLAIHAGDGPCVPCTAYEGLVYARAAGGDLHGAVTAARAWVAVQPAVPRAWDVLETALSMTGDDDAAIEAGGRAAALSQDPNTVIGLGRTLLMSRRYAEVDSLIHALHGTNDSSLAHGLLDLQATLERERGQYRRSLETLARLKDHDLELVEADGLARTGRWHQARRIFESSGHRDASSGAQPVTAVGARAYVWAHALEGDALARAGDTLMVKALADSLATVGARSYYGRDWGLYHHLRGLLAEARGNLPDAEHEFHAARWGVSGWTRSVVDEALTQLAQKQVTEGINTLRDAYAAPLDAMGRYVPRSELDYWMARAWSTAGRPDSADRYAALVRSAWGSADPESRRLLQSVTTPVRGSARDLDDLSMR